MSQIVHDRRSSPLARRHQPGNTATQLPVAQPGNIRRRDPADSWWRAVSNRLTPHEWRRRLVHMSLEGQLRTEQKAHAGKVLAAALSHDGQRLATVGSDGFVRVWATSGLDKLAEWQASGQPLHAVAADPSGEYVAAAGDDGVVRSFKWDGSNKTLNTFTGSWGYAPSNSNGGPWSATAVCIKQ